MSSFRIDINGLRAWAVSFVVLFHFGISGFEFGFVGVDIFFVISGYLMTMILYKSLYIEKKFTYKEFYYRRFVRIYPALALMLTLILVLGWFFFSAQEYLRYVKSMLSSLLFLSNIEYWQTSGYFSSNSHDNWLLHTWSLSVEWQFYLLYPIFLVAVNRVFNGRYLVSSIVFGFLLSLVLSIYFSQSKPTASFYLLPTRAWELLIGGLVYLLSLKTKYFENFLVFCFGVGLILVSAYFIDARTVWPGSMALIPVVATSLIILSKREGAILLSFKPIQNLGLWSYSIYLWHWPIVVVGNYCGVFDSELFKLLGIILSVLLGYFSYSYVEAQKILVNAFSKKSHILFPVLIVAPLIVLNNDGVYGRVSELADTLADGEVDFSERRSECIDHFSKGLKPCIYGEGDTSVLVVGDSHAAAIADSLSRALPSSISVVEFSESGCPSIINVNNPQRPKCKDFVNYLFKYLEEKEDLTVVVSNRYAAYVHGIFEEKNKKQPIVYFEDINKSGDIPIYLDAIDRTMCSLANRFNVIAVGAVPEQGVHIPRHTSRKVILDQQFEQGVSIKDYRDRNLDVNSLLGGLDHKCGLSFVDVESIFCPEEFCLSSLDGRALYFDDDHLSIFGADIVAKEIMKFMRIINSEKGISKTDI